MLVKTIAKYLVDEASTAVRSQQILPLILVLAFVLRVTFALTTDYIAHPHEIFEYLEPADRLVFGQGTVTWEYAYGTRSWIIPGFVALILKCLAALGLDRPDIYLPTVRLVFCAISLSLPVSVYRIAQALLDEGAARLALVGTAFWYELIFLRQRRCRMRWRPMPSSPRWRSCSAARGAVRPLFSVFLPG